MENVSIQLIDFHRFALNNIKHFEMKMNASVQIILGRNGCGKSSLMSFINPFPADKNAFGPNGSKVYVCKHNGDTYTLKSTFTPAPRHSFIKNGETELNEGGTATVQHDLCKSVFGLDQAYLDIVVGLETFTEMSPARRREIFTKMNTTNFDYAIKVYNRMKEAYRDTSGALKLAKKRLTTEVTSDVLDEDYDKIKGQLDKLTEQSIELYQKKVTNTPSYTQAAKKVADVTQEIRNLSKLFRQARASVLKNSFWAPSEIQDEIQMMKNDLIKLNTQLEDLNSQHQQQKLKIGNTTFISPQELDSMVREVVRKVDENNELLKGLKTAITPKNARQACLAMSNVKEPLKELLSVMPDNASDWFSSSALQSTRDTLEKKRSDLSKAYRVIANLEATNKHFEHLQSSDDINCPKCQASFKAGYNPQEHEDLKKRITAGNTYVENLEKDIAELSEKYEQLCEYENYLGKLKHIVSTTPDLGELWSVVITQGGIKDNPRAALTQVELFRHDLNIHVAFENNVDKIRELKSQISVAEDGNAKLQKNEIDKLTQIEERVGLVTSQMAATQVNLEKAQKYLSKIQFIESLCEKMQGLIVKLDNSLKCAGDSILNEAIDKALKETHIEIAQMTSRVNSLGARRNLIEDIKQQIKKLETDATAYKLLLDTFSPTDGIIAEGMLGFIKKFVRAMNVVISKGWSYKMTIADCSTESDSADLTYRFPVIVEGDPKPRDDVKFCSNGMKEMINLAFRLIAKNYLGYANYPLFVDEFGSSFDAEHKIRAPHAIKAISEQFDFKQVFIISHHQMDYGVFPNADFVVIDKNNINLSSSVKYNEHVTIA